MGEFPPRIVEVHPPADDHFRGDVIHAGVPRPGRSQWKKASPSIHSCPVDRVATADQRGVDGSFEPDTIRPDALGRARVKEVQVSQVHAAVGRCPEKVRAGMVELQVGIVVGQSLDHQSATGPRLHVPAFGPPDGPVSVTVSAVRAPLLFDQEKRWIAARVAATHVPQVADCLLGLPVQAIRR